MRVAKSKAVSQVEDEIRKQGFSTFSILDASKGITRFFTFLDLFLGIFGSLALAVASLGIVNTLVMAILERRREIGIMKALGASDGDVKRIFFVEAGSHGNSGRRIGRRPGLDDWARHQLCHQYLFAAARHQAGKFLGGAGMAGGGCAGIFSVCEHVCGIVSGVACGKARSGAGAEA